MDSKIEKVDEENLRSWLSGGPWDFEGPRWRKNLRKKIKNCKTVDLTSSTRWTHHITLREYDEEDSIISKYGNFWNIYFLFLFISILIFEIRKRG